MRLGIFLVTVALVFFSFLPVQGSKGVSVILSVAHVTRQVGEIHETRIYVMRDHKYFAEVIDQKQPSQRPNCTETLGVLSDKSFQRITVLEDSPKLHSLHNSSSTISHNDGDFWYISTPSKTGTKFLAFNSKDKNTPEVIKHLKVWFEETAKLTPLKSIGVRDYQCSVFSDETAEGWRR